MREVSVGTKEEDMTPSSITERPEFVAGQWSLHLPAPFSVPSLHPPLAQHWSFLYPRARHSFSMFPILFPGAKEPLCGLLNQVLLTQPSNGELLAASTPPLSFPVLPRTSPLSLCFVILGGVHLPKALSLDNSGLLR